jgi:glycerol-3-phosphate O-acyltransferase
VALPAPPKFTVTELVLDPQMTQLQTSVWYSPLRRMFGPLSARSSTLLKRRTPETHMPERQDTPAAVLPNGSLWPPQRGAPTVLLVRDDGVPDREVIDRFIARIRASVADDVELHVASSPAEAAVLGEHGDAAIAPLRIAWLPPGRDGDRRWRMSDLRRLREEIHLSARQRQRILTAEPDRCRILVGAPARLSELRDRMREDSDNGDLPSFIDRQARLALDRCERSVTGPRYKVPRDVREEMVASRRFEDGIRALAHDLDRPAVEVREEALSYLEEMVSRQNPLAREIWARWARGLYARAYELSFEPAALERLRALNAEHPLVFLPTHKSNLDGYVMASLLYEQGFPPNHTLGGINMAFWPLGPLGRRVGVIWIRRTIRDNPVYRWVLRQYLGYLVGKRFNLEWYIEGGRTRTGKLLPPKMGLLRYLVDAIQDSGVDDVQIVPVSVVYDQLEEVAEMTAESRGAVKHSEGLRWLIDYARRQNRPSGRVQVNFGEPVGISGALEAAGAADDPRLALSKLAFEVCTRINRVTPVTRTGMVTLAMLGVDGRSLTAEEVRDVLEPLRRYAEARALPGAREISDLATVAGTERALATLIEHGVVHRFDKGPEPVYAIGPDNELVAAFYRNGVIHWFVNRSIAELALVRVAEEEPDRDPIDVAWAEAFRLRDVLKFEFFFADKERFRAEMRAELELIEPSWHGTGELSLSDVGRALAGSGALTAHRVLSSFLEAYHVVAECLAGDDARENFDQQAFLTRCLALGQQLRLQQRIVNGEAVSTELFKSALKLADNRGLLELRAEDLQARRDGFAAELRDLVRRIRIVAEIDRDQRMMNPRA